MGAIVAITGEAGDPSLGFRLERMLSRSPYRGRAESLLEGPLAIGVQSLGWDASLASHGDWVVALHGHVTGWEELAVEGLGEVRDEGVSPAKMLAMAYGRLGDRVFRGLRGEWAAIIWDRRHRTIVAVRDPVGLRPLFWKHIPSGLALATEIRQLLALDGERGTVVPHELAYWLAGPPMARPETVYEGIFQVLPGSKVVFPGKGRADPFSETYWEEPAERRNGDIEEHAARLRTVIEQAVRDAVPAVPFSVGLSGGVDSTVIWSVLQTAAFPEARTGVLAVSSVYPGMSCDERETIRRTHEHFGTSGLFVDVSKLHFVDFLEKVAERSDLPFHPMTFSLFPVLGEATAEGKRVHLVGQGPDEFLRGSSAFLIDELVKLRWLTAVGDCRRVGQLYGDRRRLLKELARGVARAVFRRPRLFRRPDWLADPLAGWLGERWAEWYSRLDGLSLHRAELRGYLEGYRSGGSIVPMEQVAASQVVELRFPLLTGPVIEEAMRIPSRLITGGGRWPKYLLVRAFHEVMPPDLREYREKVLFDELIQRDVRNGLQGMGEPCRLAMMGVVRPEWIQGLRKKILERPGEGEERWWGVANLVGKVVAVEAWLEALVRSEE